ncbi:MAG: hypothetical protein GXX99_07995 [Clostridiales bacterium]|nr:hypothetical protein [Clostridiales bacterium]
MNRQLNKRRCALLICGLFVLGLLLATTWIIRHADHDCVGHDCPVCALLHAVEKLLKPLSPAALGCACAFAGLGFASAFSRKGPTRGGLATLTALKTRLNN